MTCGKDALPPRFTMATLPLLSAQGTICNDTRSLGGAAVELDAAAPQPEHMTHHPLKLRLILSLTALLAAWPRIYKSKGQDLLDSKARYV